MFNTYKNSFTFKENQLVFRNFEDIADAPSTQEIAAEKEIAAKKVTTNTKNALSSLKSELTTTTPRSKNPETPDKPMTDQQKQAIINNPNTTPQQLDQLVEMSSDYIKFNIASNPKTSPETLDRLSQNQNTLIQQAVANNPNTRFRTLSRLAESDNYDVKTAAQNTLLVATKI